MKLRARLSTLSLLTLGTAGAVIAVAAGGSKEAPDDPLPAPPAQRVRVADVELREEARASRFAGIVRAHRRAQLAFSIAGRVTERPVEVGDRVDAGALLARIDTGQYRNAVAAAEARRHDAIARRDQLRRDHERADLLAARRVAAAEAVEQIAAALSSAEAAVRAADADLAESHRLLRESHLRAPFAGTVTEVLLEPGEYAQPGIPVVVMTGSEDLEIELEVPESLVTELREDDAVEVTLPLSRARELRGRIDSIGRAAPGAGRLFPVVVALPPANGVVPGVTAEAVLRGRPTARTVVPIEAVVDPSGERAFVYRADHGRAVRVPVRVASLHGARVAVEGNLDAGDAVVVGGHAYLIDGERVEIAR